MAATTCCAVLNGLGSSFLCGGKVGDVSAVSPTRLVVAAAAILPQRSHGSCCQSWWLASDYGFDPLGLGKDPAFPQMQCHCSFLLWFSFGDTIASHGWVERRVEWATPWSRTAENFANATGDQGYPGGKFLIDPLGLAGKIEDGDYVAHRKKLERLKLVEIKHASYAAQGKTPLGALGL
ncbi:chlorophyll a-b binding protein CP24 10B, chloroplastic-like [Arachis stenosperma]|uniref:chlorophyll a-b binding protein CP24 10B, chloroplastic-like n=1 Tax=Arachis stenosperma TaxID=217475 RepID=UPI0025ACDD4B|nr:chlorophyll a-b binding protein CP24 10B, chloroplastic-like [Arachis stenosperma]